VYRGFLELLKKLGEDRETPLRLVVTT